MWDYLGDELVTGILTRLLVESIIRFRGVCKSWHSLISSSYFISSHLRTTLDSHNNYNTQIFVRERDGPIVTVRALLHLDNPRVDNRYQSMLSHLSLESPCNLHIVGFGNGLICFADVLDNFLLSKFIIFNPEIGSFFLIPTPLPSITLYPVMKGFGFDDTCLDYIIFLAEPNRYVYLYSFNSNSWRFISCQNSWYSSQSSWYRSRLASTIFVKGCFHWLACDYPGEPGQDTPIGRPSQDNPAFIMVFDIKGETFRRTLFGECLLGRLSMITGFGESSIGVIQQLRSNLTHVWLMEQNGSWLKVAEKVWIGKRSRTRVGAQQVLGFRNKDELYIRFFRDGGIVSQNIKNKVVRNVMNTEAGKFGLTVLTHVPSLVLLDKMIA